MSSRERETTARRGGGGHRRSRSISRSRSPRSPPPARSRSNSYSPNGRHAPIGGGGGPPVGGGGGPYKMRAETEDGNPHYSNYYRDRFGSESPNEYQNLRITNIDPKVTNDELRDVLEKYLGRFGDMNVKVIRQMDPYERIAYVNFERTGDARDARHGCLQKLVASLGRRLTVDPAGVVRDQEGRFVKPSIPGAGARSPPYPPPRDYDRGYDRGGGGGRDRDYDRGDRDRGGRGGDRDRDRDYDRGYRSDRR